MFITSPYNILSSYIFLQINFFHIQRNCVKVKIDENDYENDIYCLRYELQVNSFSTASNMSRCAWNFFVNDSYLGIRLPRRGNYILSDNNTGRMFPRTTGWITNEAQWITYIHVWQWMVNTQDSVMAWKSFPNYWFFVKGVFPSQKSCNVY